MNIQTHPATEDDKRFARRTHHAAYRDVVLRQFGAWDENRQDQFFESKWSDSDLQIIVVDGKRCGFATVKPRPDEIQLVELVLDPSFQRQGIGTRLIHQWISFAEKNHIPVRLQVLIQSDAITLYDRMGFQEYGRTETHILMQRKAKSD